MMPKFNAGSQQGASLLHTDLYQENQQQWDRCHMNSEPYLLYEGNVRQVEHFLSLLRLDVFLYAFAMSHAVICISASELFLSRYLLYYLSSRICWQMAQFYFR